MAIERPIEDEELTTAERRILKESRTLQRRISSNKLELEKLSKELTVLKGYCEHRFKTHHPRQTAEDDSWWECRICGAQG